MKIPQFYLTLAVGVASLILSIAVVAIGQSNKRLQKQLSIQEHQIKQGAATQRVTQNILRDLAQISMKNSQVKDLLARNGYSVTAKPAAKPASAPAPATSPAPAR